MNEPGCPHLDADRLKRVCTHLLLEKDGDYLKRFTGIGLEYDLVCPHCGKLDEGIDATLRPSCSKCFEEIEDEGNWDGIIGRPEIRIRETGLRFEHERFDFPKLTSIKILDIQPIVAAPGVWLAVSSDGRLLRINLPHRTISNDTLIPNGAIDLSKELTLRTTKHGEFAAICETKGQRGIVLDLSSGETKLTLNRGEGHEDVSLFPIAFVEYPGRILVVHGTAWNRLDISDVVTGALVTDRPVWKSGCPRPEHYLDYFHCGLTVSPSGEWIADNGWVWHPMGLVTTWSVRRWLNDNVWESEDGESKRELDPRDNWDEPLCWVDDKHLAVWAYGRGWSWQLPAACIYDVVTGTQERWFSGPKGSFVFDEYLFALDKTETTVWDVATGERLLCEAGFSPKSYHPSSKCFLSIGEGGKVCLSRLVSL